MSFLLFAVKFLLKTATMTEMVPRTIEDKEHVSCRHVPSHGKVPSAYATPYLSAHAPPSLSAEALQSAHWLVTASMGFSRYHNQSKVSEGSLPCGANPQPDMESSPLLSSTSQAHAPSASQTLSAKLHGSPQSAEHTAFSLLSTHPRYHPAAFLVLPNLRFP